MHICVTDSVIYLTEPGDSYHPELGSFLGQWTNELEPFGSGAYIEQFVGAGPKNYAYKVRKLDGTSETKVKIRGFTLNYAASSKLNLKNLRSKVFEFVKMGKIHTTTIIQSQIGWSHTREVITRDISKKYSVVYSKRWVLDDFSTVPFGICKNFGLRPE